MRKQALFVAVGLAAVVAFAGAASAVTMTWGPPTTISADTDVSTSGTFKAAFHNYTGALDYFYTVNGVTFTAWAMGSVPTASNNGVTFTLDTTVGGWNGASLVAPFVNLSPSYQGLLSIAGGGRNFMMTLSGLTDGQEYAFQWWTDDSRDLGGSDRKTTATTGATSVLLDENSLNAAGGVGQYAIGTFVADSTGSLAIAFSGPIAAAPSDWQALNAFQLRAVPEPATLALLAFGGVGLLARRRRMA